MHKLTNKIYALKVIPKVNKSLKTKIQTRTMVSLLPKNLPLYGEGLKIKPGSQAAHGNGIFFGQSVRDNDFDSCMDITDLQILLEYTYMKSRSHKDNVKDKRVLKILDLVFERNLRGVLPRNKAQFHTDKWLRLSEIGFGCVKIEDLRVILKYTNENYFTLKIKDHSIQNILHTVFYEEEE